MLLHQLAVIAVAAGCASTAKPPQAWGMMAYAGEAPAIYAPSEFRPGSKLRAYRLGHLTESTEVTVAGASRAADSPLFGPDGSNANWKHSVAEPKKVTRGAIWVSLPVEWTVRPTGRNQAAIQGPDGETGSLRSALMQEGVEVILEVGSTRQRLYFYLGYDVAPSPPGQ